MQFIHSHNLERLPPSDVPLEMNERVIAWLDYFSGPGSHHFRRYLTRSGRYVPMMRMILKEHGLPQDLVYVAMIESGFNNNAHSHASAVGPWQFIGSTGRRYGLQQDTWVDERRDPVKATHAAARFLKNLHKEFGHWYLAMAGYNAGEGRVRRAIADSGSKNFWVHADPSKKYLKAETRDYVPKYIAATIIAKRPELFGFGDVKYDKPLEFDVVRIPSQTDLNVVAKCVDEGKIDIEDLNPELRLGATPAGVRNYALKIPKDSKDKFLLAYARVPKEERIQVVTHKVRRNEKLVTIARHYGVSTRALASANGISRKAHIRAGTELVIPVGAAYHARKNSYEGDSGSKKIVYHRVRRGDTIGKIARHYRVRTSDISVWNKLNERGTIRVGQKLKIYKGGKGSSYVASRDNSSGESATYTVKEGDTPSTIASRHGIRTSDLVAWNGLNAKRPVVKVGQRLVVSKNKTTVASASPVADDSDDDVKTTTTATKTVHKLESGQTLGHVAELYGVSTKDLMKWNNIKNPKRVRAGTKLVVVSPSKEAASVVADRIEPTVVEKKTTSEPVRTASTGTTHTVEPGQTLGHIAMLYGVSTKDLMKWNNITDPRHVRAGRKLKIAMPRVDLEDEKEKMSLASASDDLMMSSEESVTSADQSNKPTVEAQPKSQPKVAAKRTYKIQSGDSLWTIAQKHGVSVDEIKKWNGMGKSNKIKPGQKIVVEK